jgi:hypothetical protein
MAIRQGFILAGLLMAAGVLSAAAQAAEAQTSGTTSPARATSTASAVAKPPTSSTAESAGRKARTLSLAEVQAWHGKHPRLFFSAADLEELRGRRASEPYRTIYLKLIERADAHLAIEPDDVAKPEYLGQDQMPHVLERLALVGLLTGDRKYSRKAAQLMAALGERGFPMPAASGEQGAGDLLLGLAMAYDWSYDLLTAEEQTALSRQLSSFALRLNMLLAADGGYYGKLAHRPGAAGHHVVAIAGGGLGLVSLALRGEVSRDLTNAWQATADECVGTYYRDAFGSDGAGIEGFDFTTYGLHGALPYTLARRRMDKVDPAEGTALASAPSWYVYELLPGPAMLPLGDSGADLGAEDALAAMFAACPGDAVHAWFYARTYGGEGRRTFGTASDSWCSGDVATYLWYAAKQQEIDLAARMPLGKQFPAGGLAFVRSGWGDPAGDTVVSFHCPARAHLGRWQFDVNQFTLYSYKVGWAIDSGYAWKVVGNEFALTPSGGSQAHNLMQIDDAGATKPFGRMLTFLDEKDWALAVGDGAASYGLKTWRRYLAVGKRKERVRYLLVIDEIEPADGAAHAYRHFLHTAEGNKVDLAGQVARITAANGAIGQFAVVAPRGVTLTVSDFETLASGKHPRIEVAHKTAGPFYYVAVLVPRAAGDERPMAIHPEPEKEGVIAFRLKVDDLEDRICILTKPGAAPPEGYGQAKRRLQLTNGAFDKSLLFDLEEPGHDAPVEKK